MFHPLRSVGNATRFFGVAVAALVVVGTATSCGDSSDDDKGGTTTPPGAPPSDVEQSLQAHQWMLVFDETVPEISSAAPVSLSFDKGLLSGGSSCNTYRGTYSVEDTTIGIGELASTEMACDPELMDAEQRYLAALVEVTDVDVTDPERLVLSGRDDVRLTFEAQDLDTAVEGAWTITSVNTGDALGSPIEGTEPTLTFEADGTLGVDAGCNAMSTRWSIENGSISIDAPQSTMMACEEPAGVMDQEAALGAALEAATRVEVTDTLTLFDDQDRMLVVAVRSTE